MATTLAIVGAGRVGRALGRRLREMGWKIGAVVTRSKATSRAAVRAIGGGTATVGVTAAALAADVILIAVPDRIIAQTARELAAVGLPLQNRIVLHTSGAQDSQVLRPLARQGAAVGSMHPFQTFSAKRVPEFRGLLFTIEGAPRAQRMARQIARQLGSVAVSIPGRVKPAYHCAGAFSAGHLLTVVETGAQILTRLGFPRRLALRGLLRMARETLDNLERLGPRATWTGPVARGDYSTIAKHFAVLRAFPPEVREAHDALLRLSARVLAKNPAPVLKQLQAAAQKSRRKRLE